MYTTVFAVTVSLAPFYWGSFIFLISYIWIDTICPTLCLQRRNAWDWLHWMCYIACNDWKIRLSFLSETARLEYYCTSEIYRGIPLLSASTVDSIYNGFYIVFYRVAPCHSRPRKTWKQRGSAAGFAGDEPMRVEELRWTSALCGDAPYERIRPASKVKIYVCLSVCLCQIFAHQFNP